MPQSYRIDVKRSARFQHHRTNLNRITFISLDLLDHTLLPLHYSLLRTHRIHHNYHTHTLQLDKQDSVPVEEQIVVVVVVAERGISD